MEAFDKDTRAGLAYALELTLNNIAGHYGLTPAVLRAEDAEGTMDYGAFILVGIISALQGFLLEEPGGKAEHLLDMTLDALDPVVMEAMNRGPLAPSDLKVVN
jgi:hypothetical protein